jgi:hypothetical protein
MQSQKRQPVTPAVRIARTAKTNNFFILGFSHSTLPALRVAIDRQLYNTPHDVQTQRVVFFQPPAGMSNR